MIIFDIENYADDSDRAKLEALGIKVFQRENAYFELKVGEKESEILDAARSNKRPIMLKGDTAADAMRLCLENPDIIFIAGGFFSKSYEVIHTAMLLAECENAYINLSGNFSWLNYYLHELVRKVPAERLLFGTAYPYTNPAYKKATVLWELRDLPSAVVEKIMYSNAVRLFGGV